jgi:hypothetical protein
MHKLKHKTSQKYDPLALQETNTLKKFSVYTSKPEIDRTLSKRDTSRMDNRSKSAQYTNKTVYSSMNKTGQHGSNKFQRDQRKKFNLKVLILPSCWKEIQP